MHHEKGGVSFCFPRSAKRQKPHLAGGGGRCAGNAAAFAVGAFTQRKHAESGGIHRPNSQYQAKLEQQLEELISQLQGAGHTTVMVTLSTGEETVYAVDTQTGDMQQQETHVLLQDGSALAETTYLPQVCGVAVLCEGGGDVRVAARITELLHSLLDLPTNRICVEQRKR